MFESKYSNFLTVLLVIVIIAIIGCLAFGGYKVYQQFNSTKDANNFVNEFIQNTTNQIANNTNTNTNIDNNTTTDGNDILNEIQTTPGGNTSTESEGKPYKGFTAIGTIEIPKTNLSYPILEERSDLSLKTSVAHWYGPRPNEKGNCLILGHNYRDGQFFANNKNLSVGDKIYITDLSGQRLTYTIYNKFETTPEDTEFITRNTNGAREISLQTCTDDGSMRLIILAKCDLDS